MYRQYDRQYDRIEMLEKRIDSLSERIREMEKINSHLKEGSLKLDKNRDDRNRHKLWSRIEELLGDKNVVSSEEIAEKLQISHRRITSGVSYARKHLGKVVYSISNGVNDKASYMLDSTKTIESRGENNMGQMGRKIKIRSPQEQVIYAKNRSIRAKTTYDMYYSKKWLEMEPYLEANKGKMIETKELMKIGNLNSDKHVAVVLSYGRKHRGKIIISSRALGLGGGSYRYDG